MKVKCKLCGLNGFFDEAKVSEFWASRFLMLHIPIKKELLHSKNTIFICRKCISAVLDALKSESYRIDRLYKPDISDVKESRKGNKK